MTVYIVEYETDPVYGVYDILWVFQREQQAQTYIDDYCKETNSNRLRCIVSEHTVQV